ncbi:hypothetical protein [Leptospira alexanderi]|uniref:hypothetical protein n=1 Tax=Leptospira alexanderi TaxID=100053 RepID=UPI0011155FC1|nr:hypothetical protein [Leptospira alexanderi]
MREIPSYIQRSKILESSTSIVWKGSGMHFGPSEGTKPHSVVDRLTVCGVTALGAAIQEWVLWRLHNKINIELYLYHIDAVQAWMIDYRYKDDEKLKGSIPEDTKINSALGDAVWMMRLISSDEYWEIPEPSYSAVSLKSIAKQLIQPEGKTAFTKWLSWAHDRILELAPTPKRFLKDPDEFESEEEYHKAGRPYFGEPIPLEALNPDFDYKPQMRKKLLSDFLSRLDYKKNPFLRSPEMMKKLGFKGTPYQYP